MMMIAMVTGVHVDLAEPGPLHFFYNRRVWHDSPHSAESQISSWTAQLLPGVWPPTLLSALAEPGATDVTATTVGDIPQW